MAGNVQTVLGILALVFIMLGVIAILPGALNSPSGQFASGPCYDASIVVLNGSFAPAGQDTGTLTLTVQNKGSSSLKANTILSYASSLDVRPAAYSLEPGANSVTVLNVQASLDEATVHGITCPVNDLIKADQISGLQ